MDDYFGNWADLNGDGEVDDFEALVELDEMDRMDRFISGEENEDEEEEIDYDLALAGLSRDDLDWMDEEERNRVLEEAGLDPDDYEF